jgi:hypothetical protein
MSATWRTAARDGESLFPFENGDPSHFKQRLSALDARLDALHGQDQALALEMDADAPRTPDTDTLQVVADHLEHTIANGEPE